MAVSAFLGQVDICLIPKLVIFFTDSVVQRFTLVQTLVSVEMIHYMLRLMAY